MASSAPVLLQICQKIHTRYLWPGVSSRATGRSAAMVGHLHLFPSAYTAARSLGFFSPLVFFFPKRRGEEPE